MSENEGHGYVALGPNKVALTIQCPEEDGSQLDIALVKPEDMDREHPAHQLAKLVSQIVMQQVRLHADMDEDDCEVVWEDDE